MVTGPSSKKENESKYEMLKKPTDYTDVAYREAVSRLRYLLHESYVPSQSKYSTGTYKPEESDEDSAASPIATDRTRTARMSPFRRPFLPHRFPKKVQQSSHYYTDDSPENINQLTSSPELVAFIERQEEYIDQLEKEAQYCRDELSHLLRKVKELITENETLQDQQKTGLMKVMFDGTDEEKLGDYQSPRKFTKPVEGPLIVFESRISELEAQLTQSKIDLRKAQEEAEMYKRKLEDTQPSSSNYDFYKQIENLQREKRDLNESLAKLQASINQIREKEIDASKKVQRTLDVVDKTQFEKQQAEMEVYRLKSELELQHDKLLEVISEQTKKVADERSQAERRYQQHVERLNADLTAQRDALSKLQMELEKHHRVEEDLKRDLNSKNQTIESVKKELHNKIATLQKELSTALAERDSLEQELNSSKMSSERTERFNKQESNRLQVEISALKKRLDGGDAELIHSRRENLRLLEKISDLEKELTLYKIKLGEQRDPIEDEEQKAREKIINSRISEIEAKHGKNLIPVVPDRYLVGAQVERVSDLEGLIENQSQVMAQLKAECQSLTQKLEESTARHKQEMDSVQSRLNSLNTKMETNFGTQPWTSDDALKEAEPVANRYQPLGDENKFGNREPIDYSQQFLDEERNKTSTSGYNGNYSTLQSEASYPKTTDLNYGSVSGNDYEGITGTRSGNGSKIDEPSPYYEGQGSNNYSNYYGTELGSTGNYPDQQQSSYPDQQTSSYQEQMSYGDQQPYEYQEQSSSLQGQSSYPEQGSYQYQDQVKYPGDLPSTTAEEVNNASLTAPPQPLTVPQTEPLESSPPEPKPPPSEPVKTTPSQRFQRAAELSRQTSKAEDPSTRGKLSSQTRARNLQMSRNQTKTQSRFK
ncbi:hypothetical protein RUM44_006949 [Polyplax serrata]|uniref:Uncharacterized protein n=1 Tax=Polyplax serrata TaxID=468196 RepID=A0ABR1AZU0_POLSC